MKPVPLYPLKFEPIYQYRPWGGQRLATVVSATLPSGPIGEAWILTDRDDHSSVISEGPLKGSTLREVMKQWPGQLLGEQAGAFIRFPLLLKFLDVRGALSVQVHPSDLQAAYLPPGESGKTEAWVVLATEEGSRIYAGLTPDTTSEVLRRSLEKGCVIDHLASFIPSPGDAVVIPAGTVHSLRDVVVFEVQENSDVTFRLYDWNHVDPKTHRCRPLQVEQAMACADFTQGPITPAIALIEQSEPAVREQIFNCQHFRVSRLRSGSPFKVGAIAELRVLVCLGGDCEVMYGGATFALGLGDVMVLPAAIGVCSCVPRGSINILEISLPHGAGQ